MLVVMALGRAALLEPGQAPGVEAQRANLRSAVEAVAEIARHHDVVITHGSGPQVGLLAYESALFPGVADYPLLGADVLLLLTDVPAVSSDWGTAFARPIHRAAPSHLRGLPFAPESMGPKVAAACRFVERTGKRAAIGAITEAAAILQGGAGTQVIQGRQTDLASRRRSRLGVRRAVVPRTDNPPQAEEVLP